MAVICGVQSKHLLGLAVRGGRELPNKHGARPALIWACRGEGAVLFGQIPVRHHGEDIGKSLSWEAMNWLQGIDDGPDTRPHRRQQCVENHQLR